MKRRVVLLGVLALLAGPGSALAQGLPGGRAPDAIDRARALATQPFSTVPLPAGPVERYVPARSVYSPDLQRQVVVPAHFERSVNDQRVQVPPLVITDPDGRNPVVVPGGERPPLERRQGP